MKAEYYLIQRKYYSSEGYSLETRVTEDMPPLPEMLPRKTVRELFSFQLVLVFNLPLVLFVHSEGYRIRKFYCCWSLWSRANQRKLGSW